MTTRRQLALNLFDIYPGGHHGAGWRCLRIGPQRLRYQYPGSGARRRNVSSMPCSSPTARRWPTTSAMARFRLQALDLAVGDRGGNIISTQSERPPPPITNPIISPTPLCLARPSQRRPGRWNIVTTSAAAAAYQKFQPHRTSRPPSAMTSRNSMRSSPGSGTVGRTTRWSPIRLPGSMPTQPRFARSTMSEASTSRCATLNAPLAVRKASRSMSSRFVRDGRSFAAQWAEASSPPQTISARPSTATSETGCRLRTIEPREDPAGHPSPSSRFDRGRGRWLSRRFVDGVPIRSTNLHRMIGLDLSGSIDSGPFPRHLIRPTARSVSRAA